jgi:hypothetical protein
MVRRVVLGNECGLIPVLLPVSGGNRDEEAMRPFVGELAVPRIGDGRVGWTADSSVSCWCGIRMDPISLSAFPNDLRSTTVTMLPSISSA